MVRLSGQSGFASRFERPAKPCRSVIFWHRGQKWSFQMLHWLGEQLLATQWSVCVRTGYSICHLTPASKASKLLDRKHMRKNVSPLRPTGSSKNWKSSLHRIHLASRSASVISPALRSGGEDAKEEEEDSERSEADGRRGGSKGQCGDHACSCKSICTWAPGWKISWEFCFLLTNHQLEEKEMGLKLATSGFFKMFHSLSC